VVGEACLNERRKGPLAPSSEPTSTAPCISSAVGAVQAGERAQEFEDQPQDPGNQNSMHGVVAQVVVALAEGSHMDSTARVARNPAPDPALEDATGSDTRTAVRKAVASVALGSHRKE
jgi:hypothetical protein